MADQRPHENRFRCTASRRRAVAAAAPAPALAGVPAGARALSAGQENRSPAEPATTGPANRPDVRWVRPHAHGHAPAAIARGPRAALSGALVTMAEEVRPALMACGAAGFARALRQAVDTTHAVPMTGGAN